MNGTVKEWVEKAQRDFATAQREIRATENVNYDAVCFHAQQSIEKLLKALLIHKKSIPPKSHDLVQLSQKLSAACAEWAWPDNELRFLTRAAVDYRYPGESADIEEAQTALEIASRMRINLLQLFQIEK